MESAALTQEDIRTHDTFTALMWAFSHPGRASTLPGALDGSGPHLLNTIGETLLDLETSFWTPDGALRSALAATGARELDPSAAAYLFWPTLLAEQLVYLEQALIGSMPVPEDSATLVIGCTLGRGDALRMSGPGIQGDLTVLVGGLPASFWDARERRRHYPLGWDLLLVDDDRVLGVPRSTTVELVREVA